MTNNRLQAKSCKWAKVKTKAICVRANYIKANIIIFYARMDMRVDYAKANTIKIWRGNCNGKEYWGKQKGEKSNIVLDW